MGGVRRLVYDNEQAHEAAGATKYQIGTNYPDDVYFEITARDLAIMETAGYPEFITYLNVEIGEHLTVKAIDEVIRRLASQLRKPFRVVERLSMIEAIRVLNQAETACPVGPSPPSATNPEPTDLPSAPAKPEEPAAELSSKPRPSPDALVLAAAYELDKSGLKVNMSAACKKAGVDRSNIRRRYPGIVKAIKDMARPGKTPPPATWNHRTGNLDAIDE